MSAEAATTGRGELPEAPLRWVFLGLYVLFAVAELGLCVVQDVAGEPTESTRLLRVFTKPALMPLLLAWLLTARRPYRDRPVDISVRAVCFALAFSLAGDVFLLDALDPAGKEPRWFLLGVGGFLLAHVCYVYSFVSRVELKQFCSLRSAVFVLPYLVYGYLLFSTIYPKLSKETNPVLVPGVLLYTCALLATAITMLVRKVLDQDAPSTNYLVVGAILFVESDSVIAVQEYGPGTVWFGTTLIMATYIIGQWLIAYGVLLRLRNGLGEGPEAPESA